MELKPASICASVRPCVGVFTLSNMNISETSGLIPINFLSEASYWGEGKTALGFGPDRIKTLVSMATDSSNLVLLGKTASPIFIGCLIASFSYLHVRITYVRTWISSKFGQILT